MKCIIQRVLHASVIVNQQEVATINQGIVAFVGYSKQDTSSVNKWLSEKLLGLRIFSDTDGKMNVSVMDIHGQILLISNFTLCAQTTKGMRPGFSDAEMPEKASALFTELYNLLSDSKIDVQKGVFGADMKISLLNDGPVTFILEQ